ncbi:MAG: type II toxin-antitoxin system VapC family toxin [Chitinispirillaceae bacterium]
MKYMLDTNICIYIIKKKPISVLSRLQNEAITDVVVSSITLAELEYGVYKSSRVEQNKLALLRFFTPIEIVPFDDMAAGKYGQIRAALERAGRPIGSLDTLIAAHALSLRLILVTNNTSEFKRVKGLRVENWVKSNVE